jgi:hypothetical protein
MPTFANMQAAAETLNDRHLRLWGIPLIVVMTLVGSMPYFFPGRWDLFWIYLATGLAYGGLTWEVCRWIIIRLRRRWPGVAHTRRRIILSTLSCTLVAAGTQLAMALVYQYGGIIPPGLAGKSLWSVWLLSFSGPLFFVLLNNSVYEAMYFFGEYKSLLQKTEQFKKQQALRQFEALKNRVNPHFLFNSLTTLSALIAEDAPRAERFVDELSKVYRYLLRAGRQENTTLTEEVQFADSYAFLLQNRFEEGTFSLKKSWEGRGDMPCAHCLLPTLSVQNALDYLLRTRHTPLHITMEIAQNRVHIHCRSQRKTLSFDASENDWQPLQNRGATQQERENEIIISIPFTEVPDEL